MVVVVVATAVGGVAEVKDCCQLEDFLVVRAVEVDRMKPVVVVVVVVIVTKVGVVVEVKVVVIVEKIVHKHFEFVVVATFVDVVRCFVVDVV